MRRPGWHRPDEPHSAAELCPGAIKGMMLPAKPGEYMWAPNGAILRGPWQGGEFGFTTGRSIFNPHDPLVQSYEVTVELHGEAVDTERVTVEDGALILHE